MHSIKESMSTVGLSLWMLWGSELSVQLKGQQYLSLIRGKC